MTEQTKTPVQARPARRAREAYDCDIHSSPSSDMPMTSLVVNREGISAAEVMILIRIHGEGVQNLRRSALPPRDPEEDLRLLRRIYGSRAQKSPARDAFEAIVAGRSATQLPATLPAELMGAEEA